ncbi:MAG: asparaginase [Candidatus Eremiobacteraeota bacterium]|nr:asparaginase [Candidatus Eremiobacteraeota bacterium]MBV8222190.1 asparaginase [Candidatus Eremiobacteraeota bacterium]MBV8282195.1 asparaginase [Candidatus Eremiobacteraeota bacterium]
MHTQRIPAPFDTGAAPSVVITRGGITESEHFVRHALARPDGSIVSSAGDIDGPAFMRSSAKPLICAVVVESGAADRYGLTDEELAVAAGSHSGEPYHVAAVRSILSKIGLSEDALACGPHPPLHEQSARALATAGIEPGRIHNNCSGKHASILALAMFRGAPPQGYLAAEHPAQVEIIEGCAELLGLRPSSIAIGVDGCGIPVIGVPMRAAATCFARFAQLDRFAARWRTPLQRVIGAMTINPRYVAGTGRFDTDLMDAGDGSILCKGGAEGYHATSALTSGLGLAVKVADGNYRAVAPFVTKLLAQHGVLDRAHVEALARHARPKIKNYAGTVVGEIVAR